MVTGYRFVEISIFERNIMVKGSHLAGDMEMGPIAGYSNLCFNPGIPVTAPEFLAARHGCLDA